MRLRQILKENWEILAICDDNERCRLLEDFISFGDQTLVSKMMSLIERAAVQGPPLRNKLQCKKLTKHIYEFKAGPKRGAEIRVLWFYSAGRVIICTHAFPKASKKTPPGEIDRAESARKQYLQARKQGEIPVIIDD